MTEGIASRERADCTVRALAIVAGIDYERAHAIAQDGGRGKGRRVKALKVIGAAKRAGYSFRKLRFRTRTVRRFIREYPIGRFYCRKRGHAFAIVDGEVAGAVHRDRAIITDAWVLEVDGLAS